MSKRDTLMVHIKWYYRTNEVPEQVYQLLIQDRTTEHNNLNRLQVQKHLFKWFDDVFLFDPGWLKCIVQLNVEICK